MSADAYDPYGGAPTVTIEMSTDDAATASVFMLTVGLYNRDNPYLTIGQDMLNDVQEATGPFVSVTLRNGQWGRLVTVLWSVSTGMDGTHPFANAIRSRATQIHDYLLNETALATEELYF